MSEVASARLRELKSRGGFFRIGPRARFSVCGPDARRYLNGQVTIDVGKIPESTSRSACLLTAKGKICAVGFVWARGADFLFEGPASIREELQARLERYLIADDVTVTDESREDAGVHVFGSAFPAVGRRISRLGIPGYDIEAPPGGAIEASDDEIDTLRILHGVPGWGTEIDTDTLVQEVRLEETSVDFDKGCYVGQEVVSRLKSVGRVNRRLHGFLGDFQQTLKMPVRLAPVARPNESAGTLTSIQRDFELARTVALGYLHRNFEDVDRFLATDPSGQMLGEVEKREFPIS